MSAGVMCRTSLPYHAESAKNKTNDSIITIKAKQLYHNN
jgi:hypothetical protein